MAGRTGTLREQEAKDLLAAKGMRVTGQRVMILRELSKRRAPTSHPELTLRLEGAGLDRATIYRNLVSLTSAGLLIRSQLGDNVWRFELLQSTAVHHGEHPHFVCNDCGDVACLPEDAVSLIGEAMLVEVAEVQLRGRCVACARM